MERQPTNNASERESTGGDASKKSSRIDKRYHTPLEGAYDSVEHLVQASRILIDMVNTIQGMFPNWTAEQQLKGGISAYNAGPRNVRSYDGMDIGTTGNDYANDVVARAQWLRRNQRF